MRDRSFFYILPIFFCITPAYAAAATFFVATTGDDSRTCATSQNTATPKRNIMGSNGGIACLQTPGDKLIVRGGTYNEQITNRNGQDFPSGSSWTNSFTVAAYPNEIVTLTQPMGFGDCCQNAPLPQMSYWIFDGFHINVHDSGNNGLIMNQNHVDHIRFSNMDLTNNFASNASPLGDWLVLGGDATGMCLAGGGGPLEFINIEIHDCGAYGIYFTGHDSLFDNLRVHDVYGYGFHIYHYGVQDVINNTVRNTKVYNVRSVLRNGVTNSGVGILLSSGYGHRAYNNIIYNSGVGIALSGTNHAVYNNTVYGMTNTDYGGINTERSTDSVVKNNIFYGSAVSIYGVIGANTVFSNNLCGATGTGCTMTGNPLFVNPSAGDFHLQTSSPAINSGANLSNECFTHDGKTECLTADFEGTPRPQGSAYDIGADEFGTSPTPTPTPSGITYYVATTGSDSNSCTQARSISTPKGTLKGGWSCMAAGDTLLVRGGTYAEQLFHGFEGFAFVSGTAQAYSTMRNYNGETVTIRPPAGTTKYRVMDFNANVHHIEIDGFILDGVNILYDVIKIAGGNHLRFRNNEIKNARAQGILLVGVLGVGDEYNEFIHNTIHNNGTSVTGHDHGFYLETNNNVVEGNEFYGNAGYGLSVFNEYTGQSANNNIIRGNIFHDNATIWTQSAGIGVSSGSGNKIYNNIVYNEPYIGIRVQYGNTQNTLVYNNTVFNGGSLAGLYVGSDASNAIVKNNIAYGPVGISNLASSSTFTNNLCSVAGTGCAVVGDPKLVSTTDFHLQSSSPAINAGANLSNECFTRDGKTECLTTDFEGTIRPQGSAYDIGADEYGAGSTSPTPTPIPQSCQNPTPIPSGFSAPCPVFGVSPASGSLSQNFTASVKPDASKTVWIYKTMYITEGSSWKSITLPGTVQYTYWLQGNVTYNFQPTTLGLTAGTHYLASWDWTWDAANQCYKGPGSTACGGGSYRIYQITIQ